MLELDIKKLLLLQAKACLNVNELAKKAEMPRTTVSKILHGERKANTKSIGLLAKALDVDVIEILIEEN
ncbi:helix-turn-helix domain-containing protein [Clostridium butyricum]|uniref:helix-turn-helix domain-containing protein n=1 Tax=Clostridium butyricum TaxID=1492 RepID=UPI003D3560A5